MNRLLPLAIVLASAACSPFEATPEGTSDAGKDATPSTTPPLESGLSWEGSQGEEGWTIDNVLDNDTTDCCDACGTSLPNPCTTNAAQGCNNTGILAPPNKLTFSSGVAAPSGGSHRADGFYAKRSFGPLAMGKSYRVEFKFSRLSAKASGSTGEETNQIPVWTVSARQQGGNPSVVSGMWGANKCMSCNDAAGVTGKTDTFTATAANVEVVVSASHRFSQCKSVISEVEIDAEYVRVVPQ